MSQADARPRVEIRDLGDDVPPVSERLEAARDAIVSRLATLLE